MTINIKKMIAHEIDPTSVAPILINKLINIPHKFKSEIDSFFSKHIETSRYAKQSVSCNFRDTNVTAYKEINLLQQQINKDQSFIDVSISMTQRLHQIMKTSSSKSSGTIIFIIFETNNIDFLGILKMDSNRVLKFNHKNNTFDIQEGVLPSEKEKLHKCAFIKLVPNLMAESIHLQVLDKQQRPEPSKFFMYTFLGAKETFNDELVTKLFKDTVTEFAVNNKINKDLDVLTFLDDFDQLVQPGVSFNIDNEMDTFLSRYDLGDEERDLLIESIKQDMHSKDERSYFTFKVAMKNEFFTLTDANNQFRFKFPLGCYDRTIFIEENELENKVVITINGINMKENIEKLESIIEKNRGILKGS